MRRLGDRRAGREADDGSADTAASTREHGSPGLAAIAATLEPESGCRVLDLGPAVPANIDFYGRFARHVRVLDAVGELASHVVEDDNDSGVEEVVDGLLRPAKGDFDAVLAWDLVSHVAPEVARSVFARLQDVCPQGSRLLLMTYEGATKPALPQVFEIRGHDTLLYRPCSADVVPAVAIPPARVERLLGEFRVESSYLLRHGVREYAATRV